MLRSALVLVVSILLSAPALAGPILLIEQERFYRSVTTSDEDPPVVVFDEATDFSPFDFRGHQSSLSSNVLTGDLVGAGGASGPFPETGTNARASFRVVFDLLTAGTFDLDGQVEVRDSRFFGLGFAEVVLSVFNGAAFDPIFSQQATGDGDLFVIDERFRDLPAGRYQLEALATGDGFWGSQDVSITGRGSASFTFTTPEPGSGVLGGLALVGLGLARRRRRHLCS